MKTAPCPSAPPRDASPRTRTSWPAAAVAVLLASGALTSCAGAHVDALTMRQDAAAPAPLAVEVVPLALIPEAAGDGASQAASAQAAQRLARNAVALRRVLVASLQKQGIAVVGAPTPASLLLQVDLERANGGDVLSRDVIGFGAGKSRLAGNVRLEDERQGPPLILETFAISADSGSMPGLLVSAINPIALAVRGGLTVARGVASDGHEDADRAARSIASRVVAYYRGQGWIPAA